MHLVKVRTKGQVTIPEALCKQLGVKVGDLLEASVERGKMTLTPKSVVDRGIAQSLAEFRKGHGRGPFETHEQFTKSLHEDSGEAER
jgi:bifunctional DNA-binding transcriptional regulator/antitoxin component of YhaV-PrlF toxin-antitoxin module